MKATINTDIETKYDVYCDVCGKLIKSDLKLDHYYSVVVTSQGYKAVQDICDVDCLAKFEEEIFETAKADNKDISVQVTTAPV